MSWEDEKVRTTTTIRKEHKMFIDMEGIILSKFLENALDEALQEKKDELIQDAEKRKNLAERADMKAREVSAPSKEDIEKIFIE